MTGTVAMAFEKTGLNSTVPGSFERPESLRHVSDKESVIGTVGNSSVPDSEKLRLGWRAVLEKHGISVPFDADAAPDVKSQQVTAGPAGPDVHANSVKGNPQRIDEGVITARKEARSIIHVQLAALAGPDRRTIAHSAGEPFVLSTPKAPEQLIPAEHRDSTLRIPSAARRESAGATEAVPKETSAAMSAFPTSLPMDIPAPLSLPANQIAVAKSPARSSNAKVAGDRALPIGEQNSERMPTAPTHRTLPISTASKDPHLEGQVTNTAPAVSAVPQQHTRAIAEQTNTTRASGGESLQEPLSADGAEISFRNHAAMEGSLNSSRAPQLYSQPGEGNPPPSKLTEPREMPKDCEAPAPRPPSRHDIVVPERANNEWSWIQSKTTAAASTEHHVTQADNLFAPVANQPASAISNIVPDQITHASRTSFAQSNRAMDNPQGPFGVIDHQSADVAPQWIRASAHHAEAGFQDPSIGWVSVRAQAEPGGVRATVIPGSIEAAQVLTAHLGGLNAHLADHYSQVQPVTVSAPDSSWSSRGLGGDMPQGHGGDARQGGQQSTEDRDPVRPIAGLSSSSFIPGNARAQGELSPLSVSGTGSNGVHVSVMV